MDVRLMRRPIADLLSGRSRCLLALNAPSTRHESSYRRSKQRLNIKPHSSLLQQNQLQDHIIFNPPSSMPSVLHTPLKFLPKEDPRKPLIAATHKKLSASETRLPPPVFKQQRVPHHHLTDKDIEEIIRLKTTEPDEWFNTNLARKFNCSSHFISVILEECGRRGVDNTKRQKEMKEKFAAIEARWGPRRRKAKEEQDRRFKLAYRGD